MKRFQDADGYLHQSIQELEALAVEDQSNEQAESDLAQSLYGLGDIQFGEGKSNDALRTHSESLDLRQAWRPTTPTTWWPNGAALLVAAVGACAALAPALRSMRISPIRALR